MDSAQTVFVAGCDSEVGFVAARTFVEKGYTVLAAMKSPGFLNQIYAGDLLDYSLNQPGELHILELDVTSNSSVGFAASEAFKLVDNKIDVLINVEEAGSTGYTETFTVEQFKYIFDINVFGFQRICRAFLPQFRKRRSGLIINVSGLFSCFVIPYAGAFTAAKCAVDGLTESYRAELAPTGVEVSLVEPGGFDPSVVEDMLTMPDDLNRVRTYEETEHLPVEAWRQIIQEFQYSDDGPAQVTQELINLIESPVGQRPKRIIVNDMPASKALAEYYQQKEKVQGQLLSSLNLEEIQAV